MTVSRALRNHPEVSSKTRDRILQIANQLGYRPDPQIIKMMQYMRTSEKRELSENLGFLWLDSTREDIQASLYLDQLMNGAVDRARQLGFGIEQFWLTDPGMSMRRIDRILQARGITGLIISPIQRHLNIELELEWDRYACVLIGDGHLAPPLHRVQHHHYQGMSLAMTKLAAAGFRRPGMFLLSGSPERQDHKWEASFLIHHPLGVREASDLLLVGAGITMKTVREWIQSCKPDVLLVQSELDPGLISPAKKRKQKLPSFVVMDWNSNHLDRKIAGIDQQYALSGATAVDLVTAHIYRNEKGVPPHAKLVLSEGRWVAGDSLKQPA